MPTPTYDLLVSSVLSSSASSVTLNSLDTVAAGYRDLVLVCDFLADGAGYFRLRFNGDTTDGNYSYVYGAGTGTIGDAGTGSQAYVNIGVLTSSSVRNLFVANLLDYAQTKHKTTISRFNNTTYGTQMNTHRWSNTAAVTSLTLAAAWGNFSSGSTFYLYGIVS